MAKTSVNTMDQPMKIKESMAYRVFNVFNTILMILICAAMLYPFLYLVAQSFSSTEAIVAGEVGLIPKDFSVETYAFVINDGRFIPYYGNTIVYSVIATVCALFFSALLAYPLSKPELWGGKPQLHPHDQPGPARHRCRLHPARHDLHLLRHPHAFLLHHGSP